MDSASYTLTGTYFVVSGCMDFMLPSRHLVHEVSSPQAFDGLYVLESTYAQASEDRTTPDAPRDVP